MFIRCLGLLGICLVSVHASASANTNMHTPYKCYLDTNRGEQWVDGVTAVNLDQAKVSAKNEILEKVIPITVYNVTCRKEKTVNISTKG